jgi:hypothetical protein
MRGQRLKPNSGVWWSRKGNEGWNWSQPSHLTGTDEYEAYPYERLRHERIAVAEAEPFGHVVRRMIRRHGRKRSPRRGSRCGARVGHEGHGRVLGHLHRKCDRRNQTRKRVDCAPNPVSDTREDLVLNYTQRACCVEAVNTPAGCDGGARVGSAQARCRYQAVRSQGRRSLACERHPPACVRRQRRGYPATAHLCCCAANPPLKSSLRLCELRTGW